MRFAILACLIALALPAYAGDVFYDATITRVVDGDTLLVTSDHGNIESLAAPAHTRNPVPLLVAGPGAPAFADVADIAGIAGAILAAL